MAKKQKTISEDVASALTDRVETDYSLILSSMKEENAPVKEDPSSIDIPEDLRLEVEEWKKKAFAAGYRLISMDEKPEARTKRIQLVMRPSLYEEAKAQADSKNLSFNEYINRLIEEAVLKEGDTK